MIEFDVGCVDAPLLMGRSTASGRELLRLQDRCGVQRLGLLEYKTQRVRAQSQITHSHVTDSMPFQIQMPSDNVPPRPPVPRRARRAPDVIQYPYPDTERILAHLETSGVKEESKGYVHVYE